MSETMYWGSDRITRRGWVALFWNLLDLRHSGTWRYMLAPYDGCWWEDTGWTNRRGKPCAWSWPGFGTVWCRMTGHRSVFWYSGGLEPNMDCMGCGEDLG